MNHDPADLDGDGEFDGIDIVLLEEEEREKSKDSNKQNTGCCFPFLIIGTSVTGAAYFIKQFIG